MLLKKWLRRTDPAADLRSTGQRRVAPAEDTCGGWDRSADNERYAPRFEAKLVASIEVEDDAFVGFTENVSESGVFVSTQAVSKIGAEVSLLIALPDLALVRAQGTVRWIRSAANGQPAGMGIRFDRLSALDAVRIHEFVRARQSRHIGSEGASLRSA